MAPTQFPMAKLLSRKMLPMPRHRSKDQSKKVFKVVKTRRIEKLSTQTTIAKRELSEKEVNRALVYANVLQNYQHPDEEIIASMRKKAGMKPTTAPPLASSLQPTTRAAVPFNGRVQVAAVTPALPLSLGNSAPMAPNPPKTYDWEEKAQKVIKRDRLSLDKDWSKITWKQKSSNIARLKLLKNDGYDISPLEGKSSADQIIDALLAHIEARKQRAAPIPTSGVASTYEPGNKSSQPQDEGSPAGVPETGRGVLIGASASKAVNGNPTSGPSRNFYPQKPIPVEPRLRPKGRFYETQEVIGTKRKHTHENDGQPEWHEKRPQLHLHEIYDQQRELSAETHDASSCTCGFSPSKLMRIATPEEIEKIFKVQAFELVKWRASRDIFAASRGARRFFRSHVTPSGGQSTSAPQLVADSTEPVMPCRIVFTEHHAPAVQPNGSDIYMGSTGFNYIKDEIKCLSYQCGNDGSYQIRDHEQLQDQEGDTVMGHIDPLGEPFRHEIRLSSSDENVTVVEGEPRALVGLLNHLTQNDLIHLGRYSYGEIKENAELGRDPEMKVLYNESIHFNLSKATDLALKKIERMLKEVENEGGLEVRVGVVHQCNRCTVF